jgi:hypothetical protein
MAAHEFRVGQTVQFRTEPFHVSTGLGTFEVIKQLPGRDGEFDIASRTWRSRTSAGVRARGARMMWATARPG